MKSRDESVESMQSDCLAPSQTVGHIFILIFLSSIQYDIKFYVFFQKCL